MLCTPLERYDPSYFRNNNSTMNRPLSNLPPLLWPPPVIFLRPGHLRDFSLLTFRRQILTGTQTIEMMYGIIVSLIPLFGSHSACWAFPEFAPPCVRLRYEDSMVDVPRMLFDVFNVHAENIYAGTATTY